MLVGAPIAARRQRELEDVVGLFANMVPLRLDLRSARTFRDLVGHVRRVSQDAFCHQDLPIEDLIAELDRDWPADRAPLIQVIFALYNYPRAFVELTGVQEEALSDSPPSEALQIYAPGDVRPDLCIRVYDQLGRAERTCFVEYNALVLGHERVDRLLADYLALLGRLAADPGAPLAELPADG
jgi:non-ribosomal peptide synthetase component F